MEVDDLAAPLAPDLIKAPQKPEASVLESCAYLSVMAASYIALIALTLILSIEAAKNTFRPSKGSIVIAGAIHAAMEPAENLSPWEQVCGNFGGSGLLARHQARELYKMRSLIRDHSGSHSALLTDCLSPPLSKTVYLSVPERWSHGFDVDGLTISAAPGAYTPSHETRVYVSTALPAHGAAVFEPPKPIQGCPAADAALLSLGLPSTTIAYTDDPQAICQRLGGINLTAPAKKISIALSKKTCSHVIAKAYSNVYANLYIQRLPQSRQAEVYDMFERIRSAALDLLGHFGPRFKEKLKTLQLLPAVYTNIPALADLPDSHKNFTSWLLTLKRNEWLQGWDKETTAPAMQPWAVNAYYDPLKNVVFIPPGLLGISFPDTAPALSYATLGFIIAHEIAHATDPSGVHFDGRGVYNPIALPARYAVFVKCLKSNAAIEGIHVNQTLGENYADTVGWFILKNMASIFDGSAELSLLGLGSGQEAAEAAFARMWCTNPDHVSAEELNNTIFFDPHPPADFRVNTALHWQAYKECRPR